jgi:hypothetical protein
MFDLQAAVEAISMIVRLSGAPPIVPGAVYQARQDYIRNGWTITEGGVDAYNCTTKPEAFDMLEYLSGMNPKPRTCQPAQTLSRDEAMAALYG